MPDFSWALRGERRRLGRRIALVAACAVLAGCGSSGGGDGAASSAEPSGPGASSSAPATTEPTGSPSPSSTLSAAEQQAFEEATAVVLAYRQTITDLYSGARTDLNDLNDVATGELLDKGLMNIQQGLDQGWSREPVGVRLSLVDAVPVAFQLNKTPETLVIRACIDATEVTVVGPEGQRKPGIREEADYTVTRTDYLAPPGWAVSRVTGEEAEAERLC